jgi:excisionase family DNA binding protein
MEHADLSETIPMEKQGLRSYRGGRPKGARNRRRDPGDAVMLRLPDAARRYGVSETKLKSWIRDGQIRSIKIGNIRLIEAASLNRLMGIT